MGVKVEENCRIVHVWEMGLTRILICLSIQGSNSGASLIRALGIHGMETAALLVCVHVCPRVASLFHSCGHSLSLRPRMSSRGSCLGALQGSGCVI